MNAGAIGGQRAGDAVDDGVDAAGVDAPGLVMVVRGVVMQDKLAPRTQLRAMA